MARNSEVVAVVFVLLLTSSCLVSNGKRQEHQQLHDVNNENEAKGSSFPDEQNPHRECNRQDYNCWKFGSKVGNNH